MWVLLRLPRFGGAKHANGYDNRSRHCQVGLSVARGRCCWPSGHPPSAEAPLCASVLPEAADMPDRHRGLRLIAPLVARAPGARSYCTADAAGLCEALREAAQE